MPAKVKRTVTEVSEVPAAEPELPAVPGETDLWDYLDSLKDDDWPKRVFYVYQLEPPITKVVGQAAYREKFQSKFNVEMLRDLDPNVRVWKVMEKVYGSPGQRAVWIIPVVPRAQSSADHAAVAAATSDSARIFDKGAEVLERAQAITQSAVNKSVEIMGGAYQKAVEMQAKPAESTADVLVKMKELGLLKGESGLDFEKIQNFFGFALTALKEAGIIGVKPQENAKNKLGEITEILDFFEQRGLRGAAPEASPWLQLLASFGPQVAKTLENVTGNVVRILELRAGLAGTPAAGPPAAPSPSAIQPPLPSAPPAAPTAPPNGTPPANQPQIISEWIKAQLVNLYKGGYNARQVARWVEMTAPDLITELSKVPDAMALALFDADPVLHNIGQDDAAKEFKAALLKRLRESAAKPEEPAAPGAATPEAGSAPAAA
jgi:hypothetical protein